jgi:hypothetical protein
MNKSFEGSNTPYSIMKPTFTTHYTHREYKTDVNLEKWATHQ